MLTYDKVPDGGWGWVVTISVCLAYAIVWAVPRGYSVLFVDFQEHFKSSNSATSWITSLMLGCLACGTLPGSMITGMVGARRTMMLGGFMSCVGVIIISQAQTISVAYIGSMITGIGFGFSYCSASSQIGIYFDKKRSLAFGIASLGSPANGVLLPLLLVNLEEAYGWQGAVLISAGICMNLMVGGALLRPVTIFGESPIKNNNSDDKSSISIPLQESKLVKVDPDMIDPLNEVGQWIDIDVLDLLRYPHVDTMYFLQAMSKSTSNMQLNHAESRCSIEEAVTLSLPHLPVFQTPLSKRSVYKQAILNNMANNNELNNSLDHQGMPRCSSRISLHDIRQMNQSHTDYAGSSIVISQTFENKLYLNNKISSRIQSTISPYLTLLGQWRFMLFALVGFTDFLVRLIPTCFIVVHVQTLGVDRERAAFLLVIFSILDTIIRPIAGFVTNRMPQEKLRRGLEIFAFGGAQGVMCVLNLLAPSATQYHMLALYMGLYGITNGLNSAWCFPILTRLVPVNHLHHAIGVFHFFCGIGLLIGPPLAGFMADVTGHYHIVFYFTGIVMFASCTAAWILYGLVQKYGIRRIDVSLQKTN